MSSKGIKLFATGLVLSLSIGLTGCHGEGKPTKEQVSAGVQKVFSENATMKQLGDEKIKKISDCIAEDIHGKLSDEALKSVADGKDIMDKSSKDYPIVFDASRSCAEKVVKEG